MSEYTPDMGSIRAWYAGAVDEYRCDTGMTEEEGEAAFDRALAAHDRALREQIAREIMERLPKVLAQESHDECGWLSDGLYKDAEADSMDSEVYVRDGGIDLDQIAEYAARIVGGK